MRERVAGRPQVPAPGRRGHTVGGGGGTGGVCAVGNGVRGGAPRLARPAGSRKEAGPPCAPFPKTCGPRAVRRRGASVEHRAVDRLAPAVCAPARWWLHPPYCVSATAALERHPRSRRVGRGAGGSGSLRVPGSLGSPRPWLPHGDGGTGRGWTWRPRRGTRSARALCAPARPAAPPASPPPRAQPAVPGPAHRERGSLRGPPRGHTYWRFRVLFH